MPISPASLLLPYQPTDLREQFFLEQMRGLAAHSESWRRTHYQPGHFTVSAFVFSEDLQEVALIWHPRFERWLQPGGHLEPEDADFFAGARREVEEELGIFTLKPLLEKGIWDIDIHEIPAKKGEPDHQHLDVRFAFVTDQRAFGGELEARWLKLSERLQITSDESVQRGLSKMSRYQRSKKALTPSSTPPESGPPP